VWISHDADTVCECSAVVPPVVQHAMCTVQSSVMHGMPGDYSGQYRPEHSGSQTRWLAQLLTLATAHQHQLVDYAAGAIVLVTSHFSGEDYYCHVTMNN